MLPRTRREKRFECNQDLYEQAIQDMNSKGKGFRKCTMTNIAIDCTSRFLRVRRVDSNSSRVQYEATYKKSNMGVHGRRQKEVDTLIPYPNIW